MPRTLPPLAALSTAALLLAAPAMAQEGPKCGPLPKIEEALAETYHEARVQQGVTESGQMMLVIYASPDGATWTAIMLRSDGQACFAAAGTDWQARHDAPDEGEGL